MIFDTIIDRRGTGAIKWNSPALPGKPDVIPLWVADMDFAAPEPVVRALRERVEHPVYGYTNPDAAYFAVLKNWYAARYGAAVDEADLLLGPGVVPSLGIAVRAFSAPGEGVLVCPPVYYPFSEIVKDNGRTLVEAPLRKMESGRMEFDPAAARAAVDAAAAAGTPVKLFILCSPHNPGGLVWKREELAAVLAFARERDILVVSDEIHGDLVFPPNRFISLSDFPDAAERTIVVSTANKTFNIAGLHLSHFVVKSPDLRTRLRKGIAAAGYSQPNVFSLVAAQAAYGECGAWLDELIAYLGANIDFAVSFLNGRLPGVSARKPEGSYLIWTDVSGLIAAKGLRDDRELVAALEADARVKLTAGSVFGTGGGGFVRINAASPRALLAEGLERIEAWAKG